MAKRRKGGKRKREKNKKDESLRERESLESKKEDEEGPNSLSYSGLVILLLLGNCGEESSQKARSLGHCLRDC